MKSPNSAFDTGLITDWHYRDLCKQMSILGYRSKEPEGIPREKSVLWRMVFEELWKEGVTRDSVAKALHVPPDEIEALVGELVTAQPVVRTKQRPKLSIV